MTKKRIRRLAAIRLGGSARHYRITARRREGRCEVIVTRRPAHSWESPKRLCIASAPTWDHAARQLGSGYLRAA